MPITYRNPKVLMYSMFIITYPAIGDIGSKIKKRSLNSGKLNLRFNLKSLLISQIITNVTMNSKKTKNTNSLPRFKKAVVHPGGIIN